MALYLVTNGNTANATDLNQVINALQQPSGGQEKGMYYLGGWGNASGDAIGYGVCSQSRGSTPVSVSIDTSIDPATGVNAPSVNRLGVYGFHVFTHTSAAGTDVFVGGTYTIQY